jgi:hypothetical protein
MAFPQHNALTLTFSKVFGLETVIWNEEYVKFLLTQDHTYMIL